MPLNPSTYISPTWAPSIFTNTVVFCTGGAGTVCSAQVRALVHLGANACIIGRNVEKTEAAAKDIASAREGAKVLGIGGVDVRRFKDLEAAVRRCVEELGGLDFCIAGAAGNFLAPLTQLSPNAFKSVMDIDVLGSFHTLKAAMPHLVASASKSRAASPYNIPKTGRIIFVSATLHYAGTPLQAHVCAAKAAVDSLSASAAIELGPLGVTSNVIAPGPIGGTEGMARLARQSDHDKVAKNVPLGRFGGVRDIADASVYLFSEAGGYVNGEVLVVDGGAWRISSLGGGDSFKYPDFLLGGEAITGVKGGKKQKAKL